MTAIFQFRVLVAPAPDDTQTMGILALDDTSAVEIAPEENTGLVHFDRSAPSLASAIATATLDLERLGLRPCRPGQRELVTIPEAASRFALAVEDFRARLTGTLSERHAPRPIRKYTVGDEPVFEWPELAEWTRNRIGYVIPDDGPTLDAAGLAMRLRLHIHAGDVPDIDTLTALVTPPREHRRENPRSTDDYSGSNDSKADANEQE
ncbi:hypothetical protein [Catenuloplanes japonicus]|uniref:hypothetical protein n=1 Tax=Catenuloplanes japonicus TaxID=33876 RepID=UPI00052668F0|nr:hypothetical protein [Catenuloplanes japonicus]